MELYSISHEPYECTSPNSESHDLNGHPICWLVFLLSLTSRLNWEDKQKGPKAWARSHNIMQKWTQKTKILPLSDLLFLFHFYSLASFHSPFPIMFHLRSIVLLTILKFQGKLAWFSLYKAELCQKSSSFGSLTLILNTSWRKSTQQALPSVGHRKSCTPSTGQAKNSLSLICVCTTGLRWHSCVNLDPPSKGAQLYQMIPVNYKRHLVTASKSARFRTIFSMRYMLGSMPTVAAWGVKHSLGGVDSVWEAGWTEGGWCAVPTLSTSRSSGFIPNASAQSA